MGRVQNHKNLKTEKEGITVLKEQVKGFYVPTIEEKRKLYNIANVDYSKYSRSVDGVILNVDNIEKVSSINDFLFIEVKTTKSKSVKELPYGVFFWIY